MSMTHLRDWQAECVGHVIQHYETERHFLCQATPGAGKTLMAAEVAAQLFDQQKIDLVICFAPSVIVAEGMRSTFARRLGRRFDGGLGAVGGAYTYQSMANFTSGFWDILSDNRALVVFDEIHHCSGQDELEANSWGQQILVHVQDKARYTLALTGTPWRSDRASIALARYSDPEGRIQCHYSYGLRRAVAENVCRIPKIVLIDNMQLKLTDIRRETKTFGSIPDLLNDPGVTYEALLQNEEALRYVLELGCQHLQRIRRDVEDAAGLVVASSIKHATQVAGLLRALGQSAVMVSHCVPGAQHLIQNFQASAVQWIVSVGMVSEGTDIPRLQVCCHLSRVKTELHFRQVLGRILRKRHRADVEAWLFVLAEPELSGFARRVGEDLPDYQILLAEKAVHDREYTTNNAYPAASLNPIDIEMVPTGFDDTVPGGGTGGVEGIPRNYSIELCGRYYQEVLAIFDAPFLRA